MNKKRTLFLIVAVIAAGAFATSPYGVCSHLAGGERNERPRTLAAVRIAGIGMIRCDFWWSEIEKDDESFDFSFHDAVVADAKMSGIAILPILGKDHPQHPAPAFEDDGPWRRYIHAVAARYATDCPVIEVWNEPNHSQYGLGCQNPTNYIKVLKAAFEEIRAAAPHAKVAVGGFAGVPWNYIETLLALGARECFDIMNIHAYCIPNAPEYHYTGEGGFPRRLRALMTKYGCEGKEIWITEVGWPTNDTNPDWPPKTKEFDAKIGVNESHQATYLSRVLGLAFAEGINAIFPYELRDRGGDRFDRESCFGLLHENFTPKPAFAAYAAFTAMRPAGSVQKTGIPWHDENRMFFFPQWRRPENADALREGKPLGADAGMLWTVAKQSGSMRVRFTSTDIRFFNHLGAEIWPEQNAGGYDILISEEPVFFVGGKLVAPEFHSP